MNCVRKSDLGHTLFIRTLIWLCSSWGLLHWHYLNDAATAAAVASLPAPVRLQQSTHNNPWRNRESPFIPRKRYLTCKITTRSGLGSGGAAKRHIPPPAGLSGAVPNSLDKGSSGGTRLSAGRWPPCTPCPRCLQPEGRGSDPGT